MKLSRKRLIKVAIALILLPVISINMAEAGQTVINSLPYNVTSSDNYDTLTLANSNMFAANRAITFSSGAHDVYVDLGTDTLTWGTDGNVNTVAIWLAGGNVHDIIIDGGYLLHDPPPNALDNEVTLNAVSVRMGGGNYNIKLMNTFYRVFGRNSKIIYNESGGNPGSYNIEIYNCTFDDQMDCFTQRDMWMDNAMLALGNNNYKDGPGFLYHYKIHGCTTINAPWCNIYLQGHAMVAEVYDNYLMSDARNDLNGSFIYGTAAQCYPLAIRGRDDGSRVKVYNNVIRSGNAYAGGRGIFISGIDGQSLHPDSSIFIYNNDIEVHQGFDGEESTLNGILVRQGWRNIHIRGNTITCIGDTSSQTLAYGTGAIAGIRLTGNGDGLIVANNTIRTYFEGGYTPNYSANGPHGACIIFDEWQMNIQNVSIDSNYFDSDNICIRWGFLNGHGGNVTMRDNTYSYYQSDGDYTFYLGYGAGGSHHAYNNVIIDPIFVNNASASDLYCWDGEPDSLSIFIKVTLKARILGNNGYPVSNAEVTFTNNYGTTVGNGFTDANGNYSNVVTYKWDSNDTFSQNDSTSFNDFTVSAVKNGDNNSISYFVSADSKTPELTLPNTPGQQGNDYIPPDAIDDLGAIPGVGNGNIDLSWTAPGDDGIIGLAERYEIRYSQDPIADWNWQEAIEYPYPPTPASPGDTQNFTLNDLIIGEAYYVAIKTFDDAGLVSGLSNVPESFTHGILIPAPLTTIIDSVNHSVDVTAQTVRSYQTLYYMFELDTSDSFPNPEIALDYDFNAITGATFRNLLQETDYYWRVRAIATNGEDSSAWSPSVEFDLVGGVTVIIASGDCVYPLEGDVVSISRPILEVSNLPDINEYYFQIDNNDQFSSPDQSGSVPRSSGPTTTWQVNTNLNNGQTYYWRVSVDGVIWTAPLSFAALLEVHTFPNPYRVSEGHNIITFTNLISNSNITIASVSGSIVFQQDDIGQGDWTWDVKNNKGDDLASGVYLYYIVYDLGTSKGKFLVIR